MKSLLIPMVTLSLVASASDLRAVTPPAKIAYVEGTVWIKKKGDDKLVPAQLGESLFYGDQVKTLGGKCQVNMTASGILRLSPNTTVLFPAEENRNDKISVMRMLKGKTEQNIENLWTDEVFEVRTPSLVAGTQDQMNPDAARVGYKAGGFTDGMINRPIERNIPPGEQMGANLPAEALTKRVADLIDQGWNPPGSTSPPGGAMPVIPQNCTIELLLSYSAGPSVGGRALTLEIRDGKVSGELPETTWPAATDERPDYRWQRDADKQTGQFAGTLQGHRVSGTAKYRSGPQNIKTWERGRLTHHVVVNSTLEGTQYFDLQADGTMFWNDALTRKNHVRWLVGTGRDGMTDYVDDMGRETQHEPFFGVWRIRKQDPVPSETSEAPK